MAYYYQNYHDGLGNSPHHHGLHAGPQMDYPGYHDYSPAHHSHSSSGHSQSSGVHSSSHHSAYYDDYGVYSPTGQHFSLSVIPEAMDSMHEQYYGDPLPEDLEENFGAEDDDHGLCFTQSHRNKEKNGGTKENQFDFFLLPGVKNARPGMKVLPASSTVHQTADLMIKSTS